MDDARELLRVSDRADVPRAFHLDVLRSGDRAKKTKRAVDGDDMIEVALAGDDERRRLHA